jgi:AAA family ATP:ADP antiporter
MSDKDFNQEFNKFQQIFWPIHNYELKKFLPMVLMIFFFLFNYTIMRDTKDTLIVTAAGAEVIPFLKLWGTLPVSILFVLLYSKLSNKLKADTLFYTMVTPFLVFFVAFGYIIYPNLDSFRPDALANSMQQGIATNFPAQMHSTLTKLVEVIRVWPYAIFYVAAELWGSMGISLLFWQFANQTTRTFEARRFYSSYAQLGNLALIASGVTIVFLSDIRSTVPEGVDAWGVTLKWLSLSVGIGCIIIMGTYYWIQKNVLTDPRFYDPKDVKGSKKKGGKKLGLKESFLYLTRSPYLGCICLMVIGYGMSINLIEVVWKSQLKLQFPNENDYSTFMGKFSASTGVVTFITFTIGSNVIRRLGWKIAALLTPLMILITGGLFFIFVVFKDFVEASNILPFSVLWGAVMLGAAQNVMSKATKYALFDPTKEMSYIPLDQEAKSKGKAAIDVVGARLGKSGGGLVLQLILMFGAIMDVVPILFIFVSIIVFAWIKAALTLSGLYEQKLREEEEKEKSNS